MEKTNVICPCCGEHLGPDGRCYNSHCKEYDPLSQYFDGPSEDDLAADARQIEERLKSEGYSSAHLIVICDYADECATEGKSTIAISGVAHSREDARAILAKASADEKKYAADHGWTIITDTDDSFAACEDREAYEKNHVCFYIVEEKEAFSSGNDRKGAELSYVDLLNRLVESVRSDVIPDGERTKIENHLEALCLLLWKYSA